MLSRMRPLAAKHTVEYVSADFRVTGAAAAGWCLACRAAVPTHPHPRQPPVRHLAAVDVTARHATAATATACTPLRGSSSACASSSRVYAAATGARRGGARTPPGPPSPDQRSSGGSSSRRGEAAGEGGRRDAAQGDQVRRPHRQPPAQPPARNTRADGGLPRGSPAPGPGPASITSSDAAVGDAVAAAAGWSLGPRRVAGAGGAASPTGPPQQPGAAPGAALPGLLAALLAVVRPLEAAGYAYWAVRRTAAWLQGVTLPPGPRSSSSGSNSGSSSSGSNSGSSSSGSNSGSSSGSSSSGSNSGSSSSGNGSSPQLPTSSASSYPQQPPQPSLQSTVPGTAEGGGGLYGCSADPRHDDLDPDLEVEVQWDQMKTIHELFGRGQAAGSWVASAIQQLPGGRARFTLTAPALGGSSSSSRDVNVDVDVDAGRESLPGTSVSISCTYNTVLRANPARVRTTPRPPQQPQPQHGSDDTGAASSSSDGSSGSDISGRAPLAVLTTAAEAVVAGYDTPQVWVQSLYSVAVEADRSGDLPLAAAVEAALRDMQRELSAHNAAAWGRDTAHDAWVARFGTPAEAAARLLRDPGRCLGPLLPYLILPGSPPLPGLAVANLLGSHGHKAVALAALGARVTVVDVSAGNAAYARELAAAAGLAHAVSYIVGDVAELRLPPAPPTPNPLPGCCPEARPPASLAAGQFDLVVMEMGVLHYFLDLRAIMRDVVAPLLRPGGRFLLREFHPVSTKMVASSGKKHKVSGNYFATQPLAEVDVAYSKYEDAAAAAGMMGEKPQAAEHGGGGGGGGPRPSVFLRRWGLGEVVSAVVGSGQLAVVLLDEEPGARLDDAGLPKLFTLLAERRG